MPSLLPAIIADHEQVASEMHEKHTHRAFEFEAEAQEEQGQRFVRVAMPEEKTVETGALAAARLSSECRVKR